jgi:hypothetical protein
MDGNLPMKYKLINRTNIPREDLETLIELCVPNDLTDFVVTINYDKQYIWHAYAYPLREKKLIQIYIQKEEIKFPVLSNIREAKKAGYFPICRIQDKYELLVYLLAHELRHIWQDTVSKQNFRDSKIGSYINVDGNEYSSIYRMERDACKYAKKILEKYRKL